MRRLTRRGFLVGAAGLGVVGAGAAFLARDALRSAPAVEVDKGDFPPPRRIRDCGRPANPIVAENCRAGTDAWLLANADRRIEGFFDRRSLNRGEEAVLRVRSEDPAFRVEVYRSGYYDDLGGRRVARTGSIRAARQPEPRRDDRTGLASAANWSVSARFDTSDWPSGVYLAKLVSSGGSEGQALLVVREDDRPSDLLAFISDTTYQAYNYWGGHSLYGALEGEGRAVRVSFDRPYDNVASDQADWYLRAELPLVRWLEAEGYDVTYAGAGDAHSVRDLGGHRAWMSGSHSEYWSDEMRAAFERARDRGTHLLFMGANTCYWRVRFEPDPWTGREDRVMVCYKSNETSPTTLGPGPVEDPVSRTSMWRDPKGPNRPENALLGVMYVGQQLSHYSPLVVPADLAAGQPLYRGTGLESLRAGQSVAIGRELVGWEWDAQVDNGHSPPGLQLLSATPVNGDLMSDVGVMSQGDAVAHSATYRAPSGARVFATGTILFSWGLDRMGYRIFSGGRPQGEPDQRIQRLVANALASMGCRPGSPARST
jgi:N,N-dimethylformamidase beta subunit-like, C-terminal